MSTRTEDMLRLDELLADRAMEGLSLAQSEEAAQLAAMLGREDDESLELAAAEAALGFAATDPLAEPLPEAVRARIEAAGTAWCAASVAPAPLPIRAAATQSSSAPRFSGLAWFAAAAGLTLAALAWWGPWRGQTPNAGVVQVSAQKEREQLITTCSDSVTLTWTDWSMDGEGPEIKGVKGDIVWSDSLQKGVMRFTGLPKIEGGHYQLWIIDAERGMSQRISGGVFEGGEGELMVCVSPRLPVRKGLAFAVTIEQPGGTWVSDMKRRVVIASKG